MRKSKLLKRVLANPQNVAFNEMVSLAEPLVFACPECKEATTFLYMRMFES